MHVDFGCIRNLERLMVLTSSTSAVRIDMLIRVKRDVQVDTFITTRL